MRSSRSLLSAASHSIERFSGDEDTACFIDVGAGVESIARHLFNKLPIGLKDLVVSALEVNTCGLIPQRFVTNPAKHEASRLVRHPELDAAPSGDPMVIL